jgi:hypothetical protein
MRCAPAALALSCGIALASGAAQAATRTYIVTDFDSVRVEAPIAVAVQTRRGVTARAEGDADLLERIDLSVSSRVLTVRLKRSPFEGNRDEGAAARLFLTVPALRSAQLSGSGTLAIEGFAAQNARIVAAGSGMLSAAGVNGDTLSVLQQGSGAVRLSGKAGKATIQLSGSGSIDTGALTAPDIEVTAEGAGSVKALATRSAKIVAIGPASVTVDGHPACTVRHAGSGPVICAGEDY